MRNFISMVFLFSLLTAVSAEESVLDAEQLTEINSQVNQLIEGICVEELDECEIFWGKVLEKLENGQPIIYDGGDIDYAPGYGPAPGLRLRPEPIDNPDFRADKNERARDAREKSGHEMAGKVVKVGIDIAIGLVKKKLGLP